jgi:hypothetical protein
LAHRMLSRMEEIETMCWASEMDKPSGAIHCFRCDCHKLLIDCLLIRDG